MNRLPIVDFQLPIDVALNASANRQSAIGNQQFDGGTL
jgi:hypothetical protein